MSRDVKQKRKIGRPKREEERKTVYLSDSTFQMWNQRKRELSREGHVLTSNEFALLLLKRLDDYGLQSISPPEVTSRLDHDYHIKMPRDNESVEAADGTDHDYHNHPRSAIKENDGESDAK